MSPGPLTTADLVDMGDLDALLIRIDHLCADRDWDGVLDLRDRCRRAIERGRQLWPAASHAEYRLALEAPGRQAAAVLVAGTGRFALGPLAEVAASTHTWAELRPHLGPTPEAGMVAHERVVRGEDLTGDDHVDPTVLELPLRLQPWEPDYPLATYRAHKIEVADVPPPDARPGGRCGPSPPRRSTTPRPPGPWRSWPWRGSRSRTARWRRSRSPATRRPPSPPSARWPACAWARCRPPTPWPSWPGPRPAAGPTAAAGGWPTDGSRPGGRWPPSPAASTTGRSVPTTWARPPRTCAGTGGPTARATRPPAGRCCLAVEDERRGRAWAVRATDHA